MQKKTLIGISIIAVGLIILGSLSNVVGYQSVKSSVLSESPLFSMRTQRATNRQQNVITSHYLGEGKENLLYFPIRDNRTELLKRAIEYISKMDDNAFEQFTELCIQRMRQDPTISDMNPNEITQILQLLRTKPEILTHAFIDSNNQNLTSSDIGTVCNWFPGCVPYMILMGILAIFLIIYLLIISVLDWTVYYVWPRFCYETTECSVTFICIKT